MLILGLSKRLLALDTPSLLSGRPGIIILPREAEYSYTRFPRGFAEGRAAAVTWQHTASLVCFRGDYNLLREIELNCQIESNAHALLVFNGTVGICVV